MNELIFFHANEHVKVKVEMIQNPFPENIKKIVVDGANVAYFTRSEKRKANFVNLEILDKYLEAICRSYPRLQYSMICDASLKYRITDEDNYESWVQQGKIVQAPAKVKADEFILELMGRFDGEIALISNDLMQIYDQATRLKSRAQYGFIITFGEIVLKSIYPPLESLEFSKINPEMILNGAREVS